MGTRKQGRDVHAVFLLDKPAGLSSNQALQKVRRLLNARKAGHTGTLDPFATGMLPICLGEATKTAGFIVEGRKSYHAILQLGRATATGDTEGETVASLPVPELDEFSITAAMAKFRGPLLQIPPMYSAIKRDGKPLYELARQGIVVERQARSIEIFQLEFVSWQSPLLEFSVVCSKGTYIRTLAEDLSCALGSCGHLQALRRTAGEPFGMHRMHTLDELEEAVRNQQAERLLLAADAGLSEWPLIVLQGEEAGRFICGNTVHCKAPPGMVRVHGIDSSRPETGVSGRTLDNPATSRILGLGKIREQGLLHPVRVFAAAVSAQVCSAKPA